MRNLLSCLALVASSFLGCGHTGFVGLSEAAGPKSPAEKLPMYVARDIGVPYEILGYVFRSTEGHKSGLEAIDDQMYVLSHASEEMTELRREALRRGADAIVGLEMFPTLNGWGQPIGFSVGGLAVKLGATVPPVTTGDPAPSEVGESAEDTALPDVATDTAPLE